MKKSDFILIGLVLVIIVVAIFSTRGTKAEEDIEYPLTLTGEVGLNQITYSDYKKMVEDMREFILSKTKIDKSLLNKNKSKDWYIDYNQQVSLGCVDEILQDLDKII